jgi:HK97 family phage prohead protease
MLEQRWYREVRAADDSKFQICGYAARYGTVAHLQDFDETIEQGAFDDSVRSMADVKMLLNHDANIVLGRVGNGTLTLETDNIGLRFVCQLDPANQQHRNIYASIKRGDMDECSFAFNVPEGGQTFTARSGVPLRTLKKVKLMDCSVVTYPAYTEGTSVVARAYFDAEARSAVCAALGRPLKAPQNLVDLDQVRKMVAQWTDQENRRRAVAMGAVIKRDMEKLGFEVADDLVYINKAIMLAERDGQDTTTLKELWDETYNKNRKHLIPADIIAHVSDDGNEDGYEKLYGK